MAFDWEHVEAIRAGQDSARNRRDLNTLPTNEVSNEIYNSPLGREAKIPGLDHWEQMIHKVRTQLIDYIIEHGLVQGFEYDGINEPIKNGKIIITAEMLQRVTDRFGYFKEKETLEFIEKYLPEHHYVSDADYVHTDNNYTDEEKAKLKGIEDGAEVNKVISILFNGVETIDPTTRVATITITPADIKAWYEQNPDTNVFTDAEKAKLESINIEELSNKVIDVTLDGESVVKDKIAILTAKKIKDSYESNANTNAFTDADKTLVEQVLPELQKGVNQHEQRIDALEKSQTVQDTEIVDAKNSISELGDEVNSVAGRVTNLETSQAEQDKKIEGFVPYEGAIKDVILENHTLYVGTQTSLDNATTSARIAIGKTMGEEIPEPGLGARVSEKFALDGVSNEDITSVSVTSSEVSFGMESTVNNTLAQAMLVLADVDGIHITGTANPSRLDISPGVITGLDAPIEDKDAVNKAYVDANAGKVDDVKIGGVSVVTNRVADIPVISNVLVNCLALDANIHLSSTVGTLSSGVKYLLSIRISESTPLTVDNFINFGIEIFSRDSEGPDITGAMMTGGFSTVTLSTNGKAYVSELEIEFKFNVTDTLTPPGDVSPIPPNLISVNIVTKDTPVSIDFEHSSISTVPE